MSKDLFESDPMDSHINKAIVNVEIWRHFKDNLNATYCVEDLDRLDYVVMQWIESDFRNLGIYLPDWLLLSGAKRDELDG